MSAVPFHRAAVAAGTATPPRKASRPLARTASPDAALLVLCDRFFTAHAEAAATTTDAALTAAMDRRWGISGEIETTPAHTPSGKAAKAHVALVVLRECSDPGQSGSWERLALVALAEAAGVPVPPLPARRRRGRPAATVVPDAELLDACAKADAVKRRADALYTGPTRVEDDRERNALLDVLEAEQRPFLDRVCELRAQTLAGHMARARTLALWDKEALKPVGGWNAYLAAALVRDLVGEVRA